ATLHIALHTCLDPTSDQTPFSTLPRPRPPRPTLFPYTTLFRSARASARLRRARRRTRVVHHRPRRRHAETVRPHGLGAGRGGRRSEEHTSELQSRENLVCRLLLEKKKNFISCELVVTVA